MFLAHGQEGNKGQTDFLLAADVNRDGNVDLAGVGRVPSGTEASVYLGNGDGTLQTAKNSWVADHVSPAGAAIADFDGDGMWDLAITLGSRGIFAVLPGDGTGGFKAGSLHPGAYSIGTTVAADFDGNGTPDLAFISFGAVAVTLNEP